MVSDGGGQKMVKLKRMKKVKEIKCKPQAESAVYGVGLIGAVVYFISQATSFWMGLVGFFKALVWPAVLVYQLLEWLNK